MARRTRARVPAGVAVTDIDARLAELGIVLPGPFPPHDPLDAVVVHARPGPYLGSAAARSRRRAGAPGRAGRRPHRRAGRRSRPLVRAERVVGAASRSSAPWIASRASSRCWASSRRRRDSSNSPRWSTAPAVRCTTSSVRRDGTAAARSASPRCPEVARWRSKSRSRSAREIAAREIAVAEIRHVPNAAGGALARS